MSNDPHRNEINPYELREGEAFFNVTWTKEVSWTIVARSREEAEKAAGQVDDSDIDDGVDDWDVSVYQLRGKARKLAVDGCVDPVDVVVIDAEEYVHVKQYRELLAMEMECPECRCRGRGADFIQTTEEDIRYGEVIQLRCPSCSGHLEVSSIVPMQDTRTLPLFLEEDHG